MATTYVIANGDGTTCRMGIPEQGRREVARRIADELGEPVWLTVQGEDGDGERVDPKAAFEAFVGRLAKADLEGSRLAGTEMDAEWTGEHTTALADHLGCRVAELDESDITAAKHLYRRAVAALA